MAYNFGGAGHFFVNGSTPGGMTSLPAAGMSCSAWFNHDNVNTLAVITSIHDNVNPWHAFHFSQKRSTNGKASISAYGGPTGWADAEVSTSVSNNTWYRGVCVYTSATLRDIYVYKEDGTLLGTAQSVVSKAPTNCVNFHIGGQNFGSNAARWAGEIAEVAWWNTALTAAEAATIGKGYSPLFVRPNNLVYYAPMISDMNDIVGGLVVASEGTAPTVTVHPRVIYPSGWESQFPPAAAGASHTAEPTAGSLTITGAAPSAEITHIRQAPVVALVLSGVTPAPIVNHIRGPPVAALALTGIAPTLLQNSIRLPGADTLVIAGIAPSAEITHIRQMGEGAAAVVLTGEVPDLLENSIRTPQPGAMLLAGVAPSAEIDHIRAAGVDDLVLAGVAPVVSVGFLVAPGADELLLTGISPSSEIDHFKTPTPDALVLTGVAPTVTSALTVSPAAGALALTGIVPSAEIAHSKTPDTVTLEVTGVAPSANLGDSKTAAPAEVALTLTGITPSAEIDHSKVPTVAALVLAGVAPSVNLGDSKTADPPEIALTITGNAPTIVVTSGATSEPSVGAIVLTGNAPSAEIDHIRQVPGDVLSLASDAPVVSTASGDTITIPSAQLHVVTLEGLHLQGQAPAVSIALLPGIHATAALTISSSAPTINAIVSVQIPGTALVLTGYAPTPLQATQVVNPGVGVLVIQSVGAELEPDVLALTGQAPSIPTAGNPLVTTDNLVISSSAVTLATNLPAGAVDALAIASTAPTIAVGRVIVVAEAQNRRIIGQQVRISAGITIPSGSLDIETSIPSTNDNISVGPVARDVLQIVSAAPKAQITHIRTVPAGAITFVGATPSVSSIDFFPSAELVLSSDAPTIFAPYEVPGTKGSQHGHRSGGGTKRDRSRVGETHRFRGGKIGGRHKG